MKSLVLRRAALAAFVLAILFHPGAAGPAHATAKATSFAKGVVTIQEIRDELGGPIAPPAGFSILPTAIGPDRTAVEQSGTNTLVFNGAGSGETSFVSVIGQVFTTADPAGVAEGIETTLGGIQFINGSASTVQVLLQFQRQHQNQSEIEDHALETSETFLDIEFSLTPGGSPTSPCDSPLFEDVESKTTSPPNKNTGAVESIIERTITLPPGETCSADLLVQATARSEALAIPVPAAGPVALAALLALLAAAAFRHLRVG